MVEATKGERIWILQFGGAPGRVQSIFPDVSVMWLDQKSRRSFGVYEKGAQILGSLYHPPFRNGFFRGVVAPELPRESWDALQLLEEASRLLRPGGLMVFDASPLEGIGNRQTSACGGQGVAHTLSSLGLVEWRSPYHKFLGIRLEDSDAESPNRIFTGFLPWDADPSRLGPADQAFVHALRAHGRATFCARGASMEPLVSDGTRVRVKVFEDHQRPRVGQIVLFVHHEQLMLHFVRRRERTDFGDAYICRGLNRRGDDLPVWREAILAALVDMG